MKTIMEADLTDQIQAAIEKLKKEEEKTSTLRSLLEAARSQLVRKDKRIKELSKPSDDFKERKEMEDLMDRPGRTRPALERL